MKLQENFSQNTSTTCISLTNYEAAHILVILNNISQLGAGVAQ
jgi:hypothetical protein